VNRDTGLVNPTHGVSINTNPTNIEKYGRIPYEVDTSSIPGSLEIARRGEDPEHYEIRPRSGANLTPDEYQQALAQITVKG
jgi:hypothetical protein